MSRLYWYVERLNLTNAQRDTLVDGLKALAPNVARPQPADRNHWRVRMDGNAAIFEAEWDDTTITAVSVRNRLAALFGVSQASVTHTTSAPTILARPSEVATYRYNSQDRVRFGVFGGRDSDWGSSQAEAREYLLQNAAAWEPANP